MQNTGIVSHILHLFESAHIRSNGQNMPKITVCRENYATLLRTFQRALRFLLPTFLLRLGLAIYISCMVFTSF